VIDAAGNIIQQTSVPRINQQLAAAGFSPVTQFHHDARKLDNGDFVLLSASERILTDVQGPGDVDVVGDMILVLDSNMQLKWVWDSFAHLDITRKAVLGETCLPGGQEGCPPVLLASIANDWTHGNTVSVAPDGNIIYSSRHQDLVYKIDYNNGTGTGNVLWRLGAGGDFTTDSKETYPWNSHQHDATFQSNGVFTIFDNGNTRVTNIGSGEQSRGQVMTIDETNHKVHYLLNQKLGVYSDALGSAQLLADGNYHFDAGMVVNGDSLTEVIDYSPSGKRMFAATSSQYIYRSFRMKSLYDMGTTAVSLANNNPITAKKSGATDGNSPATTVSMASNTSTNQTIASPSPAVDAFVTTVSTVPNPVAKRSVEASKISEVTLRPGDSKTSSIDTGFKSGSGSAGTFTANVSPDSPGLTVSFTSDSTSAGTPISAVILAQRSTVPGSYEITIRHYQGDASVTSKIHVNVLGRK
jgi:hypothetical protein